MDEIRDTSKADPIGRFFDKQNVRTTPFGANQSADRAYRRAERIVAALFLITNHISPNESLRTAVRNKALSILENTIALRHEMRSVNSGALSELRVSIRNLISLNSILAVSGFLSTQNAQAVSEALDDFGTFLTSAQNSPLSEMNQLSREGMIDLPNLIKDVKDKRAIRDRSLVVSDKNNATDDTPQSRELDVRKRAIVSILEKGGAFGIRDIASHLPEYSEKMIQRDLADLVDSAKVKKIGLKRWSRYSIAS